MNAQELAEQILHTYSAAYDDKKIRALAVSLNKIWQKACEAQRHNCYLENDKRKAIHWTPPEFNIDSL